MKTKDTKQGTPGTLIEGTFRPEDLLGTFLFALEDLGHPLAQQINQELISLGFGYSQCGVCGMGDREGWPDGFDDDLATELIDDMIDALDSCAPAG